MATQTGPGPLGHHDQHHPHHRGAQPGQKRPIQSAHSSSPAPLGGSTTPFWAAVNDLAARTLFPSSMPTVKSSSPSAKTGQDSPGNFWATPVGTDLAVIFASLLLPSPNPNAPRLADSDYQKAATDLGVEVAAIYAVATVEAGSRKRGFDNFGRPIILFEAHYFHRFTKGKYDKLYPQLSQPNQKLGSKYYKLDQWKRMYQAMMLDAESAWKSASWGMFQVMGSNHSGSSNVGEFVKAMFVSEYEHLRAFLAYCKDNNLTQALKDKDWAAFALGYNGKDYAVNKYDKKMKEAYDAYITKAAKAPKADQ